MNIYIFSVFILVCISGVSQNNYPVILNLKNASIEDIKMSKIASEIEYIPLELTNGSELYAPAIYVTDKYIITVEFLDKACLFDRKTGRFIREISGHGNGPDEYIKTVRNGAFDEERNVLYVDCGNSWKCIDIETNKSVFKIVKPAFYYANEKKYQEVIMNPYKCENDLYLGYTNNISGYNPYKLLLFDSNGHVLNTISNYEYYEKVTQDSHIDYGRFYKYNNNIYFKAGELNDTVFKYYENKLIPHVIIELNNKQQSHSYKEHNSFTYRVYKEGYLFCNYLIETDNYLFFNCNEGGMVKFVNYYDKRTKRLYSSNKKSEQVGFANDIDGLSNFIPYISNNKNQLIGYMNAADALKYCTSIGHGKISKKGKDLLSNMQFDDNPIVMIVTLK